MQEYLIVNYLSRKDLARIFSKIQISTEHFYKGVPCWDWTGKLQKGYGRTSFGRRNEHVVHRVIYAWLIAPIPRGIGNGIPQLDHLCRRRHCCNPVHLELVSQRTNLLRGETIPAELSRRTHCPQGHPLSGSNLYIPPSGGRKCRKCGSLRNSERRRIRKASEPDYDRRIKQQAQEYYLRKKAAS